MKATAEGVAWFFMSEGCLNLSIIRVKRRGIGYRMYPELSISNTDVALIDCLKRYLTKNNITFKKRMVSTKNKMVHYIDLSCLSVKKFLDLVFPYLLGDKRQIAQLIYKYYDHVWLPPGHHARYKARNIDNFLRGVIIHDQICDIIGPRYNRKYDLVFFLKKFCSRDYCPNPALFDPPLKLEVLR